MFLSFVFVVKQNNDKHKPHHTYTYQFYIILWHFHSRVGRVGVSKILTKDLSHPHFVFPTLSFVLSLAPSLRRRKGDDIAPSAVKKDAVLFLFFPHMSMQSISSVCPILIFRTIRFGSRRNQFQRTTYESNSVSYMIRHIYVLLSHTSMTFT